MSEPELAKSTTSVSGHNATMNGLNKRHTVSHDSKGYLV